MEKIDIESIEKDPGLKDVSGEFLTMSPNEFSDYLKELKDEPELKIEIDWAGESKAKRLKAFLEDPNRPRGERGYTQKRTAAIRVTKEQYMQTLNVFASGVKFIKAGEWDDKKF